MLYSLFNTMPGTGPAIEFHDKVKYIGATIKTTGDDTQIVPCAAMPSEINDTG